MNMDISNKVIIIQICLAVYAWRIATQEMVSICRNLKYKNGSNVTINYFSNGSRSYSKEKIEIFKDNKILVLDNWRKLTGYGFENFTKKSIKQDKGHYNQFKILLDNQIQDGTPTIPFDQIINTTKTTLLAMNSLSENRWVDVIDD